MTVKRKIEKALAALANVSKLKVRTSYAMCSIYSTLPMVCPLCGAQVPADTQHLCQKKESR